MTMILIRSKPITGMSKQPPALNKTRMFMLTALISLALIGTSSASADTGVPTSLPSVSPSNYPSMATSVTRTLSGVPALSSKSHPSSQPSSATSFGTNVSEMPTLSSKSHPSSQPSSATSFGTNVSEMPTFSSSSSNSSDAFVEDEDNIDATPIPGAASSIHTDPTYNPTAPPTISTLTYGGDIYNDIYEGGMSRVTFPTESPTLKPTVEYIPKEGDDPLTQETEPDVADFNDDGTFYHGLGDKLGKVGEYLDGVESPRKMEKDKNVQVVGGILMVVFLVLLLVCIS